MMLHPRLRNSMNRWRLADCGRRPGSFFTRRVDSTTPNDHGKRCDRQQKPPTRRRVKNNRLSAAGYVWAFSALTASPGARAHYNRRRDAGDRHAAAQRNLFSRLLGCLHYCLITGQHYDETIAFPTASQQSRPAA
jgi:hypothetical protein